MNTIIFILMAGITLAGLGIVPSLDNAFAQAGPCTNTNPNSACSFAPGHGGTIPGQTDNPKANAPGQLKKLP